MELSVINQTNENEFEQFEMDFITIANKAWQLLEYNEQVSLAVIFVDDKQIHEINRDYRNMDRPTDVITFALQDEMSEFELQNDEIEKELGDIFISVDTAKRQAENYGHSLRREICFLFTHGLLHLLGYDHMNDEEEKEMFGLQNQILDGWMPR